VARYHCFEEVIVTDYLTLTLEDYLTLILEDSDLDINRL